MRGVSGRLASVDLYSSQGKLRPLRGVHSAVSLIENVIFLRFGMGIAVFPVH